VVGVMPGPPGGSTAPTAPILSLVQLA
jgi:hypothetical protein